MKRLLSAAVLGVGLLSVCGMVRAEATLLTPPSTTPAEAAKPAKVALVKLSGELTECPQSFKLSLSSLNASDEAAGFGVADGDIEQGGEG